MFQQVQQLAPQGHSRRIHPSSSASPEKFHPDCLLLFLLNLTLLLVVLPPGQPRLTLGEPSASACLCVSLPVCLPCPSFFSPLCHLQARGSVLRELQWWERRIGGVGGGQIIQGRQIQAGAFLPGCAALAVFPASGLQMGNGCTTVKRVCCYPAHLTGRL